LSWAAIVHPDTDAHGVDAAAAIKPLAPALTHNSVILGVVAVVIELHMTSGLQQVVASFTFTHPVLLLHTVAAAEFIRPLLPDASQNAEALVMDAHVALHSLLDASVPAFATIKPVVHVVHGVHCALLLAAANVPGGQIQQNPVVEFL
jgi:hypothetical protein